MARYKYHFVVKKDKEFKYSRADLPPKDPEIIRFSEFLWCGNDNGIWCVYRKDPRSKEIVRIEFFSPKNKKNFKRLLSS